MSQVPMIDEYPNLFEVFDACCQGIKNSPNKERIQKYIYTYLLNTASYNYLAPTGKYEKIKELETPVFDLYSNKRQLQQDFKDLYKNQLLRIGGPARKYYDQIKESQQRCLYCGKTKVEELDHFLPQSKYAIFSIFPPNLVPCCRGCNKNKREKILQLHPYYDDIHQYKWLFAKIVDDKNGSTFAFYVNPPKQLDENSKNKIIKYFSDLKLGQVYVENSVSELVEAKELYNLHLTGSQLKEELKWRFGNYDSTMINHWKRAICECIDQASDKSVLRLLEPIR